MNRFCLVALLIFILANKKKSSMFETTTRLTLVFLAAEE